jgi:hypothetical protein
MPNNPWENRRPHDAIYPGITCTGDPAEEPDPLGPAERIRQWERGILLDTELVEYVGVVAAAKTFASVDIDHDPKCAPTYPLCRACYPG